MKSLCRRRHAWEHVAYGMYGLISSFHIVGQIFDKVYTGGPKRFMVNEETVLVPPGSAAVFEMSALVPSTYLLVDQALWRVLKGAAGHMHVIATVPPTIGPIGEVTDPGSWPLDIFTSCSRSRSLASTYQPDLT